MAFGIINGMEIKIDQAGRIVLPKKVRERLRLKAGSALQLEEKPDGLVLRRAEQGASLICSDGVWVHQGKAPRGFVWNSVVDDVRDEYLEEASGL